MTCIFCICTHVSVFLSMLSEQVRSGYSALFVLVSLVLSLFRTHTHTYTPAMHQRHDQVPHRCTASGTVSCLLCVELDSLNPCRDSPGVADACPTVAGDADSPN